MLYTTLEFLSIPNVPNITPNSAREYGFKVENKSRTRVKDLTVKAKTPIGDTNCNVVYNIPCGCHKDVYL